MDQLSCENIDKVSAVTSLAPLPSQSASQDQKPYSRNEIQKLISQGIEQALENKSKSDNRGDNSETKFSRDRSPRATGKRDSTKSRSHYSPNPRDRSSSENRTESRKVQFEERARSPSPAARNRNDDASARPKKEIICTYCGRSNHVETRCFKKLRDYDQLSQANSQNLNENGLA